ncbi:M20/M25/M40 family metallo-hydrolase [Micromonospora sp. Llam7]|uniref:M20/M25/M40 family metallo-hydrolase n=1 Tax=Micromonospora tarapacensis TaxID=2835305 RepID=UPI001C82F04A|nr:M20/M25/M40 family metallo-hydrolase [Micromonospora tarapacensis]MBX7265787.1 M20/M25/M40 family metallo-hydrolase [Micromonospora tarapacensis]
MSGQATPEGGPVPDATDLDEVVGICRGLLRMDTSNPGRLERPAAEYVADLLTEAGWPVTVLAAEEGRTNVVVCIPGRQPKLDPLLVHCHLDVVPVDERRWTVDPFGGEERDGCLWGRGAVDMKDMAAMMLASARHYGRTGDSPARDVVMAFLADEEMGGNLGAGHLVRSHPSLIGGCTVAIGEVGGFSVPVGDGRRIYLVETAEKGVAWIRLTAAGAGGHASMIHGDNPITRIAHAIRRLEDGGRFQLTTGTERFLDVIAEARETPTDVRDAEAVRHLLDSLGPVSRMLHASLRHTYNATIVNAGFKENVVPSTADALIDARFLPGLEQDFRQEVERLLDGSGVQWEFERWLPAVAMANTSRALKDPVFTAIERALRTEDPTAVSTPYTLSAGTDAKSFAKLGMACYGFTPLRLPPDFDFSAQFHADDERVPIDALRFGARVLKAFLDAY